MKTITLVSIAAGLALAAPAIADDTTPATPAVTASAQQQCGSERAQMGRVIFGQTYGTNANRSNAFGMCVSKRERTTAAATEAAKDNAATACRTERAADPAAFTMKYGTGQHGANAFGKCVSQKARAQAATAAKDAVAARVNAARACKTERGADPAAFRTTYGTNANGRNAFGRCVSQKSRSGQS